MDPIAMISPRHVLTAARRIERSGLVLRTPLERSLSLSAITSADVFHKLETWQPTGSFKVRGAANKLLRLRDEDAPAFRRGFVAASAGNHGLGLAHASMAHRRLPRWCHYPLGRVRIPDSRQRHADEERLDVQHDHD